MSKAAKKEVSVVTPQAQEVVIPAYNAGDWGSPQITAKDVVIPKILPMQAMSKLVTAGTAKFGEFIDSLSNAVLGNEKNPIEFIPFYMEKVWIIFRQEKKDFKFHSVVNITPENEGLEFEGQDDEGNQVRRFRTMNFYVLLPKEVGAGTAIPYIISFRSSSARAGQKLATTMFMKNLKANKTPASMVMELSGLKTSNDKGTFIVMDVKEKRPSTNKEVAEAFEWVKTVRGGNVKVDHSDLASEAAQGTASRVEEPESDQY